MFLLLFLLGVCLAMRLVECTPSSSSNSSCWWPIPAWHTPPSDILHPQTHHLLSSIGNGWEHPESLSSPAPAGLSPSPQHTQAGVVKEVEIQEEMEHRVASPVDRDRGQQAPAACGHPPLCIVICISKATVTIVSAPSFKNRSTMSKQAL